MLSRWHISCSWVPAVLIAMLLAGLLLVQSPAEIEQIRVTSIVQARDGHHEEALAGFRRVVTANPDDHDSRVWIARLQGWLGEPAAAEATYRAVLNENPRHVDAMVGLGNLLATTGHSDEALATLAAAETEAPANPDVLAGLARSHRLRGETSTALAYIERAVALAPTDENLLAREQIRLIHAHRVEVIAFGESMAGVADARSVEASANVRLHDRFRAEVRGQSQRRFDAGERRAGGGLEWRAGRSTLIAASFLGGRDNVVLPRTDFNLEVFHAAGGAEWLGGYRQVRFAAADVSILTSGVLYSFTDFSFVLARYHLALTGYTSGIPLQASNSLLIRGSHHAWRRTWLSAGYARGTENFETLTVDRLGEFTADTVSGGVRFDLPSLTTVGVTYEYQWRTNSTQMQRLTLVMAQRF